LSALLAAYPQSCETPAIDLRGAVGRAATLNANSLKEVRQRVFFVQFTAPVIDAVGLLHASIMKTGLPESFCLYTSIILLVPAALGQSAASVPYGADFEIGIGPEWSS